MLVCGNFTSFNGANRGYAARLNADGSVDQSFWAQPGYWVRNMAVQPDGKIVIGGYFTTVQGVPRNLIARLNSDGSLDTSFNPGTGATDIIAGGIDGDIDPFVFWVAVQPDGKIIITGNFRNYNGQSSVGVARLNPDGSRDATFNVGGGLDSWGRHIELLPNGQIRLSGWFTQYRGQSFNRLVRINSDGSPDNSFNPYFGDSTSCYCTALQGDGKIVVSGHSINAQGLFHREIERLNPDGSVDPNFVASTTDKTESVVLQPDGKVIAAGYFAQADGTARTSIARFNPDGTLDNSFSANIDNFVWGAALEPDGKLLIAGGFYTVDGYSRSGVARLLTGINSGGGGPADVPPNLSVASVTANSISLRWADSSAIRTGYVIEQKNSSGAYNQVGSAPPGIYSFNVGGLAPTTAYTFRVHANNNDGTSINSNDATGTTSVAQSTGANSASYIRSDAATQGTWKGVYGAEGYSVFGETTSNPSYVGVTPIGKSDWTWQWSTTDASALQRANGTDRLAACWYASSSYSIDLRFSDSNAHRLAVYFLDWDVMGRVETVQVTDGDTGTILDARTLTSFTRGVYLIWNLAGHVKLTVTASSGNAVASGLFFGSASATQPTAATPAISPAGGIYVSAQQLTITAGTAGGQIRYTLDGTDPTSGSALYAGPFTLSYSATVKAKTFASGYTPSATAAATYAISSATSANKFAFVGIDSSTQGNWPGVYGANGYLVVGKTPSYPSYAQPAPIGKQDWTWAGPTSDVRGLDVPGGAGRIASCWYANSFNVDLNFTDGHTHRMALYFCDWDFAGRSQTVELLDGETGTVLQSQTLSSFSGGQYWQWDLKGHLKLRFTKISGYNAVLNGLFFQPAPAEI
jgi:uncharacterized delta-60 repeat protein